MAVYQNREAYIPYSRQEIIELCLADGKIAEGDRQNFRDFCNILAAYYHFKLHRCLETLKTNFVPFDPDLDRQKQISDIVESLNLQSEENDLIDTFNTILERANYYPISKRTLDQALLEGSVFDLKTEVDFNDFETMICYGRGDVIDTITSKKWWFKKVKKEIDIYRRVVLLIKFKEEQHFKDKPVKHQELNFKPGKIYIYLYKNLSKLDLEFIFPNVKMSMNWKDRLLFGVPAVGAAIPLTLKIIPQIVLVIGVFIYLTLGHQPIAELQVKEEDVRNITPLLLAILSLIITMGGFAFKQYTNYQNKQIKFQKSITETLFYRSIANNSGVFKYIIDAAEEEECKEIILVYYHLLINNKALTPSQLDNCIEAWMEDRFNTKIDFDINKSLKNLEEIQAQITCQENSSYSSKQVSLLKRDNNYCQVLPLNEAKQAIDYVWDNIFQY